MSEKDRQELSQLLAIAAARLSTVHGPVWSSFESGAEIAVAVTECRQAIEEGVTSPRQKQTLTFIFAPTGDWDDVVGDVELGNSIFSLLTAFLNDHAHEAKEHL